MKKIRKKDYLLFFMLYFAYSMYQLMVIDFRSIGLVVLGSLLFSVLLGTITNLLFKSR